jgi:hypothetical protein
MPPKSVSKIVEFIKYEYEKWGGDPQIDEASLCRHVEEMLDLEQKPPELAPAEIVEEQVQLIGDIEWEVTVDNETTRGCSGSPTQIRAAAHWAHGRRGRLCGACPQGTPDATPPNHRAVTALILIFDRT